MICGRKEIEKAVAINKMYLDKLDFSEWMQPGVMLEYVIDQAEAKYGQGAGMPDILDGELFNWMSNDEVAEYLGERYQMDLNEETITKYWFTPKRK